MSNSLCNYSNNFYFFLIVDNKSKEHNEKIDEDSVDTCGEDVEKGFQLVEKPCQQDKVDMDPNGDSIPKNNLNTKNTEAITLTPNDFHEID